jgi:hypothetical protein
MLMQDLYHVQFLLANADLSQDERIILQGLLLRIEEEIADAEKPN